MSTNIRSNILFSSILTTAGYLFPLITYPYISRVLEVSNVGAVNFVDSIINYFILFSSLGISASGIREIAASGNDKAKRDETFSTLISLNCISTILFSIVLIISIYTIPVLREYRSLLWIGLVKLIFNLFLIEWLYKGLEEFKFITTRTILVRLLYVVSIFIFVKSENDRNLYYLLTVLSIFVNSVINLIYSRHFVVFKFSLVKISKYWRSFVGMGIYMLLTSMYGNFNVMYLGIVAGDAQVGYYTTATKIYGILLGFFTAFTGVMLPRMSSLLSEGKIDELKKKIGISYDAIVELSLPIIIYAIIFAPSLVNLISGPGYEGAILPMRITLPLILVVGIEQILIIQILMPFKKDKIILRNSFIAAAVALILNILLVDRLQSVGSAIVWVVCELLLLALSQVYVKEHLDIHLPLGQLIKILMWFIPLGGILIAVDNIEWGNYILGPAIGGIVSLIYCVLIYRFILRLPIAVSLWKRDKNRKTLFK